MISAAAHFFVAAFLLATQSTAFLAPYSNSYTKQPSCLDMSSPTGDKQQSLIVISPPGGVGEVTAVKAASMGSSVRWFVVSESGNQNVVLSQSALEGIEGAGGSVELAGADAESLLLPAEDLRSAIAAVAKWCGSADGIACTFDGVEGVATMKASDDVDPKDTWKDAIKVAVKEASASVVGPKVAILSAFEDAESEAKENEGGVGNLVGSFLGGKKVAAPASLTQALAADSSRVCLLRHGQLFGVPESSPDFSALAGGPKRNAELCEEYTMRSIRFDPTLSVTGNIMMGKNTRSSRHSVGEAAAFLSLGKLSGAGLDLCLSSQLGSEPVPLESWQEEFQRSQKMLAAGAAAQLFSASFASVPDMERMADWLATKWAPAVLRTYDIAAIRKGARPVYATRGGPGEVEIVWQELVDFKTVMVGKMIIEVSDKELIAKRGAGDASAGFGKISSKPLNGENVLLTRLAEAASQAIEKGLAKKAKSKMSAKVPVAAAPAPPVTSIQSAGTVESATAVATAPPKAPARAASESGPRQAGARRSTERARGTRKRKSPSDKKEE